MYRKNPTSWKKHFDFIVVDVLSVYVAYLLSFVIRHGFAENPFLNEKFRSLSVVLVLISLVVIFSLGIFHDVLKRNYKKEIMATFCHVFVVILFSFIYVTISYGLNKEMSLLILVTWIFYFVISSIGRICWKKWLRYKIKKNVVHRSLIVLTTSARLNNVLENVKESKEKNYGAFKFVGFAVLDKDMTGQRFDGIDIVANYDTVSQFVCREWIDEVFIDVEHTTPEIEKLMADFTEMGLTVHLKLMHASEMKDKYQFVEQMGKYTVLTASIKTATLKQLMVKRAIDILAGLVGCLVAGILFIILAPMIYIKSPGPILFKQVRLGKNGRRFNMYKFRSMYMDAEERKKEMQEENVVNSGLMFKVAWDKRIIGSEKGPDKGIGNFIRKYSLDEWPQFYNILKGDMSLIGTRPPTVDEWSQYQFHHRARLAIKPGLTGMWQVSGRSGITDFEEVVKLDKEYITNWSLWLDVKILFKTVLVVLKHDGAI